MDELFQGFARIGCFHEGFADEETAEAGGTQAADGFGVGDAAFGDKERGCRSVGGFAQLPGYPEGVLHIGDEGAEVAVVDTHHVDLLIYIGEFRRAVDFEQYLQPEFVGLGGEGAALLRTEAGGNEQYGVGTYDAGLQKLVLVDDEVLAQNGDADERTGRADVAQRTAEELLIRQDGEGGGAGRTAAVAHGEPDHRGEHHSDALRRIFGAGGACAGDGWGHSVGVSPGTAGQ